MIDGSIDVSRSKHDQPNNLNAQWLMASFLSRSYGFNSRYTIPKFSSPSTIQTPAVSSISRRNSIWVTRFVFIIH
jgi:hypothetical protein